MPDHAFRDTGVVSGAIVEVSYHAADARVLFIRTPRNDLESIIRQWSLQCLGLIPRRAHPDVAFFPFRGLLGVHSRCGLHTRAVTNL
jgi:hypothetical protein